MPPSALQIAFGKVLRQIRKEAEISQEELGYRSGLHRNYIGGIERAERNPSLTNIVKLATALDVKPSQVFERVEQTLNH